MSATAPFPLAGELAALSAAMIWATSTSLFTAHGRALSARGLNIFKNSVGLLCFIVAAAAFGTPYPGTGKAWAMLALSGFFGLSLGDTFLFASLKRLGAQVATALQCAGPPMTALMAMALLGEALSPAEWAGLAVTSAAVLGVILSQRPRRGDDGVRGDWRAVLGGVAFGLLAALCNAIGIIAARGAMADSGIIGGTIARLFPALVLLLVMARAQGEPLPYRKVWAGKRSAAYLTLASLTGTFLGLLLLSTGVKFAKAGVTSALSSSYPIWVIPFAKYALKEHVPYAAMACTALAVIGVSLMVLF